MDTKFAEQFLERVCTVLHAANDDHVYVEFVHLLNDFGEKQRTPDTVPQVRWCSLLCRIWFITIASYFKHCSFLWNEWVFLLQCMTNGDSSCPALLTFSQYLPLTGNLTLFSAFHVAFYYF